MGVRFARMLVQMLVLMRVWPIPAGVRMLPGRQANQQHGSGKADSN
jgi:hypothetical protein